MKPLAKIVISFFFLCILSSTVYAQDTSCVGNYPGLVFRTEKISQFPPYSMHMPYEVLIGYIALDTVCYNVWWNELEDFINRQTYNDTLRYMMKHYYYTLDYDPILFEKTIWYQDSTFKTPPQVFPDLIYNQANKVSDHPFLDYALLRSSYIMHVLVNDTLNITNTNEEDNSAGRFIVIVTTQIVDTIKGKIIPECIPRVGHTFNNGRKEIPRIQIAEPGDCFQFHYCPEWQRGGPLGPSLHDDNGLPWIKTGQEYIVFLDIGERCLDSNYVNYQVRSTGHDSYTFLMYPIIDGKVYDPQNEFGFGTSLTPDEFKNALRQRISEIKNYGQ